MTQELLSNCDYRDCDTSKLELISEAEVKLIIMGAVRGRLEPDGRTVAPLKVIRNKLRDGATGQTWFLGPKLNSIECPGPLILSEYCITNKEMPNGDMIRESVQPTSLKDSIYATMIGYCERIFSSGDIKVINDGLRNLANALERAGYKKGVFELEQAVPSFQFGSSRDGELPPTRLYLHRTDLSPLQVVADLVNSGVRPDYGKLWVPYGREGLQRYRQDTLILGFSEYHDLEEAVKFLRERFMRDDEIRMGAGETLYGLKIAGAPGAYVGQSRHGGASFNSEMKHYFEEAIQCACKDIRQPQTGEVLTNEWLDAMAQRTIDELGLIMLKNGRTIHRALIDSDTTTDLIKLAGGVQ